MPKRKKNANIICNHVVETIDNHEVHNSSENIPDVVFIPNGDEDSDVDELGDDSYENQINLVDEAQASYEIMYNINDSKRKKLEKSHKYNWKDGQKNYDALPESEIFQITEIKKKLVGKSPVQLFELFFSEEMKQHIIEATGENDLESDSKKL